MQIVQEDQRLPVQEQELLLIQEEELPLVQEEEPSLVQEKELLVQGEVKSIFLHRASSCTGRRYVQEKST